MAEFSENRHISNLINMSCKVNKLTDLATQRAICISFYLIAHGASLDCYRATEPELADLTDIKYEYLLSKTLQQYDRLKARGAFLEQFKKEKMFSESLDEFDNAREVRME